MSKTIEVEPGKLMNKYIDEYGESLDDFVHDVMGSIDNNLASMGIEEKNSSIVMNATLHMLASEIAMLIACLTPPSTKKALRSVERVIKLGIEGYRKTLEEQLGEDEDEEEEDEEEDEDE